MASSLKTLALAALAATAAALPGAQRLSARQLQYHELVVRQNAAAAAQGLSDPDILQFALTLENLEEAFYREGFQKFKESDFTALGLNKQQVNDLLSIGRSEQTHVELLQSSLAQAGVKPVQPCTYDFKFTDAKGMVGTAAVLENVGISAYMGAAPLLADKGILSTAASILTVEARHQSSIRIFAGLQAVPQAFDSPLGPRAVFSIAKPFITACPKGSDLAIQAFPTLTMKAGQKAATTVGSTLMLQADGGAGAGAKFCAFTSGGVLPGGTAFANFTDAGGCQVPEGVAGVSYLSLTKTAPLDGVLKDELVLAGPLVVIVS
ncbi:Protein rds1 [Tolypocladium capitatum]|uniref:Protein rds1 n=1 Tax=Tolypocladium capitatum TaxID=45235 RepID=A0A2K3QCQ6_9HYPO|nr:Protein rds1 [Tolypocladium capitatum]